MPIAGQLYPFTKTNVDDAPGSPGVYGLYRNGVTTYCGSSEVSIRTRLQRHKSGLEGPCTANAVFFNWELTAADYAKAREKQLLDEHVRQYGRLPQCNDVG